MYPPKRCVQVQMPGTCGCGFIWKHSLCRCKVKMWSYWIRVGPNPVTGIFIEGTERHRERNRGKQILTLCCQSQRMPMNTDNHQHLGRSKKAFFTRAFRGSMTLIVPWFWTSSLQSYKRINFYCYKPPSL